MSNAITRHRIGFRGVDLVHSAVSSRQYSTLRPLANSRHSTGRAVVAIVFRPSSGGADMPMKKGYGKQAIAENIRLLIREGRPPKQAAAIAYEKAREERRKAR